MEVEKEIQSQLASFFQKAEHLRQYREWIFLSFGKVYLRKSLRLIEGKTIISLDMASIEIKEKYRNQGYFSLFMRELEKINPYDLLFVENALHEKVIFWCSKREWEKKDDISFYRRAVK